VCSPIANWTTLRDKPVKIGAKVVRALFDEILRLISALRPKPAPT
jgi:hypothetical protein